MTDTVVALKTLTAFVFDMNVRRVICGGTDVACGSVSGGYGGVNCDRTGCVCDDVGVACSHVNCGGTHGVWGPCRLRDKHLAVNRLPCLHRLNLSSTSGPYMSSHASRRTSQSSRCRKYTLFYSSCAEVCKRLYSSISHPCIGNTVQYSYVLWFFSIRERFRCANAISAYIFYLYKRRPNDTIHASWHTTSISVFWKRICRVILSNNLILTLCMLAPVARK